MSEEKIIEGIRLDLDNKKFFQAAELVLLSKQDVIYLTGKAGTGKTTFLKYIREEYKSKVGNVVVLAPTGVAAVNASGQTIHSFFHLQALGFGPIPIEDSRLEKPKIYGTLQYDKEKIKIIKSLSLLIIDEASMVRCDILDAVDRILRIFRGTQKPFGGVKVLLIGDVFQLPPVVKAQDWEILNKDYASEFFFDSYAYRNSNVAYIELDKPYRQTESEFLGILDKVRVNQLSPSDLLNLNKRNATSDMDGGIVLASNNTEVDNYNINNYESIKASESVFVANEDGEFPRKEKPAPEQLRLKEGAKVMILRNRHDGERFEYFNGSIGTVSEIDTAHNIIKVKLPQGEVSVGRETWENRVYEWDDENKCVTTKVIGTYTQFPLKWAWAITIHKSQGLTFDKVYADLGGCFAPGQVYVALSRCRRLSGLYLKSPLQKDKIKVNDAVIEFSKKKTPESLLVKQIEWGKADKLYQESRKAFWRNEPEEMLSKFDEAVKIRDDRDTDGFRKFVKVALARFQFQREQNRQLFEEVYGLRADEGKRKETEAEMASNVRQLSAALQSRSKENQSMRRECERLREEIQQLKREIERLQSITWYQKMFGKK